MTRDSRQSLRDLISDRYNELVRLLIPHAGSRSAAEDALQDTWVRLEAVARDKDIQNEKSYLLQTALNIIRGGMRTQRRRPTDLVGDDEMQAVQDDGPDPEQVAIARSELDALRTALAEMPLRRQKIFLAAWDEELPPQQIAERFDLSVRMINIELKQAREHCALRLQQNRKKILDFARGEENASRE